MENKAVVDSPVYKVKQQPCPPLLPRDRNLIIRLHHLIIFVDLTHLLVVGRYYGWACHCLQGSIPSPSLYFWEISRRSFQQPKLISYPSIEWGLSFSTMHYPEVNSLLCPCGIVQGEIPFCFFGQFHNRVFFHCKGFQ